jgi:hypothetical protein
MAKQVVVHFDVVQTCTINADELALILGRRPTNHDIIEAAIGCRGSGDDKYGFCYSNDGIVITSKIVDRYDDMPVEQIPQLKILRRGKGSY